MSITKRIDAITHIPDEYKVAKPPCPKSVKIELTGRCNYRCGFCALRMRECQPKPEDDMSLDFFKKITSEMYFSGVEEIGLFYLGESLMNPNLTIQACDFLKHTLGMPYVFLTTNGSLATPAILHRLMAAGLDSLKFSINAADFDQFEEVMGVKPKLYKKALAAVKTAREVRDCGYHTKIYASSIMYDGDRSVWSNSSRSILSLTWTNTTGCRFIAWEQLPLRERQSLATDLRRGIRAELVDW